MRGLLHVVAIVLALPQVLIAIAFLLLGHLTGGGTLGSLLKRLVDLFFALFTWGGLLGVIALVTLILCGFFERTRRAAAATVAVLVIASTVSLFVQLGAPIGSDPLIFLPGLAALVISVTLAVRRVSASSLPQPLEP